ncbi:MAG: tRNA (N6-threonylcarbamoyladenosine(37)-N6)-methyltransferase TrmO [Proteobacteria bacterium]|uniref:tRNA (N6-threonylcarbamoyladenosine(37)-N6)-methyltransferase TrmO n=1 Tax=Candidatus Avisuccinivibrio stercorigallinarum TaxID=2840704 RepID=A0A9D9DCL0_9GAMM|nr:tRNA (N6-threonylcarbamoyladenosine(37)-N6)-methyltransferase TrmO [Candidatus Avisuccinivibrio stercorigallinarum]
MSKMNPSFNLPQIGVIHTPYGQKFAVPRQGGLAPAALSEIEFFAPYGDPQAFIGLEGFSHLHVLFIFHEIEEGLPFKAMVRPPRLGGNQRAGVFATRSPFRPGRLGLSVLKLRAMRVVNGLMRLSVEGADMVDGTPIVDVKPYIPFVDAHPEAAGGFASAPPPVKSVSFEPEVHKALAQRFTPDELQALEQILAQDPRPAYKAQSTDDRIYYALILGLNIGFKVTADHVTVVSAAGPHEEI